MPDNDDNEDMPEPHDYEWGGTSGDLNRPVRAHVLAALVPTDAPYVPPVDQLRYLGDPHAKDQAIQRRIAELGFTSEHVPDLMRMMRDRALNTAMSDSDEVWAPIHALTVLESLNVGEYAADLMPLFDIESDWFGERLPHALKNAGASALAPLRAYVQDPTRWVYGRAYATATFSELVAKHPELREQAVQILGEALARASENDPYVNADFINELVDLDAVEMLPVIRRAFEQDLVDESVMGGWSEVLQELGQPIDPHDPLVHRSRRRANAKQAEMQSMLPPAWHPPAPAAAAPKPKREHKAARQKHKRKTAAASRKANRKRRK